MAFDAHSNLVLAAVLTPPSPATTGTSLVLETGQGASFPTPPFNVVIWPAGTQPSATNAEIARCTDLSGDTMTLTRGPQSGDPGGITRTIVAADQVQLGPTVKTFTDIESAVTAETSRAEAAEALKAPLASPALTGIPTAPTASALTDSTQIATTAYTDSAVSVETARAEAAEALKAPLASPALTGTPTVPTATVGTNTTQAASTAFVLANAQVAFTDTGAWQASTSYVPGQTFTTLAGERRLVTTAFTSGATFGLASGGSFSAAADVLCSVRLTPSTKRTLTILTAQAQGVKFRGMQLAPPSSTGNFNAMIGSQFNLARTIAQIKQLQSDGYNVVRIGFSMSEILAGTVTLATVLGNMAQVLTAIQTAGMYGYIGLSGGADLDSGTSAQQQEWIQAFAALCHYYPNVIAVEVFNEFPSNEGNSTSAPTTGNTTTVQTVTGWVRAVTDLSVGWSLPSSSFWGTASGTVPATDATNYVPNGWVSLFASVSDYLCYHEYTTLTLTQYEWYEAWYPGVPILFGEMGGSGTQPDTSVGPRFAGYQQLHDRASCVGTLFFCMNDFGASPNQYGGYDELNDSNVSPAITNLFVARPSFYNAVKLFSKRYGYAGASESTLVIPSAPISLTTGLVTIPDSFGDLANAVATSGLGDPQYRYTVRAVGLNPSDVLEAAVVDADSGALYPYGAASTTTASTSTGSTPDASPSLAAAYAGGGVKLNVTGEFSDAITLASGQALHLNRANPIGTGGAAQSLTSLMSGTNVWTFEFWFQLASGATGTQTTLASNVGGNLWLGRPSWMLVRNTSGKPELFVWGATADGAVTFTSSTAITDTNWHAVAIVGNGSTVSLYVGGTLLGSVTPAGGTQLGEGYGGPNAVLVGIQGGTSLTNGFVGNIDEIRVSNTNRYTATYTPAVAAFTSDANTVGLWHCDALNQNTETVVQTPWTYVPAGPFTAELQIANTSGARGTVVGASKQTRYTG